MNFFGGIPLAKILDSPLVSTKAKETMTAEGEHLDGELTKTHLHESSEAAEKESKHHEDDSATVRNFDLDTPETAQSESEHQEGEHQTTEKVKKEQENQKGEVAMSHVQENAEISEEPKNNETESQKANISDGLLMAEKTEHKHSDCEFATTHVPGSLVGIAVTVATIVDSSNAPEKPESAQGFI
jgi:hypothetical protein